MSHFATLVKRYYKCYWRTKGQFFGDFLLAIVIGGLIAIGSLVNNASFLLFYVLMVPFTYMSVTRTMIGEIVYEKSSNIKEFLKLNGVTNITYQAYCIAITATKIAIFCLFICLGSAIGYYGSDNELFFDKDTISYFDLFLLYTLSGAATMSFILFLSVLFKDPKFASDLGAFFYVIVSLGSLAVMLVEDSTIPYYLVCLFPQSALTLGSYLSTPTRVPFGTKDTYPMLIVDIFLYLFLYMYLDQVIRDGNGVKKPHCFCLRRKKKTLNKKRSLQEVLIDNEKNEDDQDVSSAIFHEKTPNGLKGKKMIQVNKLKKVFGDMTAVDEITFSVQEKQLLCLLGHNGAGKTTTISMLTGLLQPDGGSIFYDGVDLYEDIEESRSKIGLCSQKDIYYNKFTVKDHLEFIARLRNIEESMVPMAVDKVIQRMGLEREVDKYVETLSGGNKRKLCLAMAVLGDTRVVFLDEPTAAMDPQSRRMIWKHIKGLRNSGLTMIMTTHHLEEADELADRIAILSKGKLLAMGSSEFLKKNFGVGYYLTIIPNYELIDAKAFNQLKPKLKNAIQKIIPESKREEQTADEVVKYLLPFDTQPHFPRLFEELEQIPQVKISMEMNSLEDTYINIGMREEEFFGKKSDSTSHQINMGLKAPACISTPPTYSFWMQYKVMFLRKAYFTFRSTRDKVLIILPALVITLGVFVTQTVDNDLVQFIFFCFFANISYALNTALYCAFPVYEKEEKLKYALDVMGLRHLPYWLGSISFDMLALTFVNLIGFACYAYFYSNLDGIIQQMAMKPYEFFLITIPFTFAAATCAYAYSFLFDKAISAIKFYPLFYYFILNTGGTLLKALLKQKGEDTDWYPLIVYLSYFICPSIAYEDAITPIQLRSDGKLYIDSLVGFWFFLFGTGLIYFLLAMIFEVRRGKFKPDVGSPLMDASQLPIDPEEIKEEAERTMRSAKDCIKAINVTKHFGDFWALKGISFGIEPGQVFGLLGPNGAGKSTTFNILTALLPKTSGSVQMMGEEVVRNKPKLFQNVGICPQFNCLWSTLTVREHLELFGGLKGLRGTDLTESIDYYLDALDLRPHENKQSQNLSGGNKRKLCVGDCLIGSPQLLFFDEPSSGVDPLARRFLWNSLHNILKARKASIVLTTHSIHEAESLAHKTGILVNGKFFCIGPTENLKAKYGAGYRITILLNEGQTSIENKVRELFPKAKVVKDGATHQETFQIPSKGFKFSEAFLKLGRLKEGGHIKDFSIYNTTLEQVFIYFSKFQVKTSNDE